MATSAQTRCGYLATQVVLWDQLGQLVLLLNRDWLLTFNGELVAFIEDDGAVYNLKGRHIAWFNGGVLRDCSGYCLAVSDHSEEAEHPPLPLLQHIPSYLPPLCMPQKHPPVMRGMRPPASRCKWSMLRLREVFRDRDLAERN